MKKILIMLCLLIIAPYLWAQQHQMSKSYVTPDDPLVQKKLENWQDLEIWFVYALGNL